MRGELPHEESIAVFNNQKGLLHKQVLRKQGFNFKRVRCRVRERNDLDKLLHRWTNKKPLVKYYTEGRNIENYRNVLEETSPYTVPATSWYRQTNVPKTKILKPDVKHYLQPTQRGRNMADLLNRVYIPPETKSLPLGICDFNPDYFSIVKGRETSGGFSKREYLEVMRKILRQNVQAGVYRDCMKFLNQQFLLNFEAISSLYRSLHDTEEILKAFSHFDENETLKVKNTQKMFWRAYSENLETIESVKNKTSLILNDVQYTWDRLLARLQCKKLLYEISSPSWKRWYDQQKKAWKPEDMESYNDLSKHYQAYIDSVGNADADIAKIVKACKEVYESLGPNLIYYSHMSQVEEVFKDLEMQSTLALEYTAIVINYREKLVKILTETEKYYSHQKKMLDGHIEVLGKKIKDNNNRAHELEEILNTKATTWFKDTIVGDETLLVKSLIQVMYDEIVGIRNRTMSNQEMMEQLELKMIRLKEDLGQIGQEEKHVMTNKLKQREKKALAKAEEAKAKDTVLKKLIQQMETSMREYPKRTWKELRPRSRPTHDQSTLQRSSRTHANTKGSTGKVSVDIPDYDDEWDCQSYRLDQYRAKTKSSIRLSDLIDN